MNLNWLLSKESLSEVMKEAVFPEFVDFLCFKVHPSFYSALLVTALLLIVAIIIRIFVIPKFKTIPGKFQALLEKCVEFFSGTAEEHLCAENGYIGAFCFCSGIYIFMGTCIEMLGFEAVFSDLNACIAMALASFFSILGIAVRTNGMRGVGNVLKDFSLPISMSFRLFGAMLSGLLVGKLVYHYIFLSFGVPIFVNVLFTLLDAIIQTFVYVTLTSIFFGENTEKKLPRQKKAKKVKSRAFASK